MTVVDEVVARVHREEWSRVVAALTRRFGDLDIAEEMAAEAFAVAVERWPADGVPANPGGWITTTASRRAIDRLRRESRRDDKQQEAQMLYGDTPPEPTGAIDDDRLRLIFICCHPALAPEARVALTLRLVGGLSVSEIARAFLVQEATVGRRITRAKAKIKMGGIPYRVPSAVDLPARVSGVLAVLYLIFNEGYLASEPGREAVRSDLTLEAIRLTRLLRVLLPSDGEVAGLLALMLLTEARRSARVSASGELVTLDEQDRGAWDAPLIAEGLTLVRERIDAVSAGRGRVGRYQILAAISAVHTSGARLSPTPTGRRSSPSTTSWRASTPRRSSSSTGPSRWPSSTGPTWRWRWSIDSPWTTITPTTPPAPTCCVELAGQLMPAPRTSRRSSCPATPPRSRTSADDVTSSGLVEPSHAQGPARAERPLPPQAGSRRSITPPSATSRGGLLELARRPAEVQGIANLAPQQPERGVGGQQPASHASTTEEYSMPDFDGRPVLVTGASGGIGGETVRQLAAAGAEVVAAGRSEEALGRLAEETGCRTLPFDLTSEDSVRDALGDLDVWGVVNCGGFGGEIATPDGHRHRRVRQGDHRSTPAVPCWSPSTRPASMIRLGHGGSIVNVSCQASLVALTGHISYGSSKAALDNITRVSALELGGYSIRVNSVNPTVVMTHMSAWYWGRPDIEQPVPGRRCRWAGGPPRTTSPRRSCSCSATAHR